MFDFFFSSNAIWLSPGRLSRRKASCKLQIHRINAEWCGVWLHWCRKSHIDSRKRAFLRAYRIFSVQRLIAFARSLCAGKSVACMQFFNELMQWRHPSYTKMGFKKFWGRTFFFLRHGRRRSKARFSHESKQCSRSFLNRNVDMDSCHISWDKSKQAKETPTSNDDDPQIPQPDLRFAKKRGQSPKSNNHK